MSSQADGPRDDDGSSVSVLQLMFATATTEESPPTIAWSGWSHGGGQLAGAATL